MRLGSYNVPSGQVDPGSGNEYETQGNLTEAIVVHLIESCKTLGTIFLLNQTPTRIFIFRFPITPTEFETDQIYALLLFPSRVICPGYTLFCCQYRPLSFFQSSVKIQPCSS